jgi:CheY-like chemotaxis protein
MLQPLGYEVISASNLREVEDFCGAGAFDLIIIDHSIPGNEKRRVAALVAERAQECPILEMYLVSPEISDANSGVRLEDGPEALLEAVKETIRVSKPKKKARPYSV